MKKYFKLAAIIAACCLTATSYSSFAYAKTGDNAQSNSFEAIASGDKTLNFDSKSGAVTITDKNTQDEWRSTPLNFDADESVKNSIKMNYDSQLMIKYADKSGNIYELSSRNYCVNRKGLKYSKVNGGIDATYYFEKCGITVPVSYILKNDRLVVSVSINGIKEENEAYKLVSWSILPYFNAGGKSDEGFLFVPDGSGAIINYNNGKSNYKAYRQYVYGRDSSIDVTAASGFTENALLPVFGSSGPHGSSFAVITDGASRCAINAQVSSQNESFNSVYAEFIYRDNTMASFNDKSWNKKEVRIFETNPPKLETFSVTYFLLPNNLSYTDMALCYQEYLTDEGVFKANAKKGKYPFYLNLYGSINAVKHVLGFPVKSEIALTKYSDTVKILEELDSSGVDNIVLKYNNWIKGGAENAIPVGAKASSALGGKSKLKKLISYTQENNIQAYFDVNLTDMYKSRIGYFKTTSSAKMLNQSPSIQYKYSLSTLQKKDTDTFWYLLNPVKVNNAADSFAKTVSKSPITGISCDTLCHKLYSSYNQSGMDRVSAEQLWIKSIESLKKSAENMLCDAPNFYALAYADAVSSLPTQSSRYAITDADVPFYQIVLHGKVNYSMEANNKFSDYAKSVLTALETGSSLQFEWIARNSDKTENTQYYTLYADEYTDWIEKATATYGEISKFMKKVSDLKITDHKIIEPYVRETTYENGMSVTVNYNDYAVSVDGMEIQPMSYKIKGE